MNTPVFAPSEWLLIGLSLGLATVLTGLVRGAARRFGIVAEPRQDRWHREPTALLGGVAIFLAAVPILFACGPRTPPFFTILAGAALVFAVGLIDDFRQIKPYKKLAAQVMAAAVVIYGGLTLPWTGLPPVDVAITVFWLVGITNAINLLDNMDGLAAGVAAIAAVFLAVNFLVDGRTAEAVVLAAFAAALLGFLIYNSNPASIFMGDCGSMFIGFFLAGSALMGLTGGRSRSVLSVLAVPVLILMIPIFDTTLVTILRKLAGRPASRGGRDHTSHRLVAMGMSERRAVWMLYAFSALSGLLALAVRELPLDTSLAVIAGFAVLLTLLGIHLARVTVYHEAEIRQARSKPWVALLFNLTHKRRIFEVLLDVVLIILSYHVAYSLLYGPVSQNGAWQSFMQVVPVLVCVKLTAFLAVGVYRGLWRYFSTSDLALYGKAVLAGSVASVLVLLFAFRFQGLSRAVFVLDGCVLLILLVASRMTFRMFRRILPPVIEPHRRRALIYGAGDAGELVLRELRCNQSHGLGPVGFIDDDPLKEGKIIHGLRVFPGNGMLPAVLRQQRIDEVIISSSKFTDARVQEIFRHCRQEQVVLKRMRIQVEVLADDGEPGDPDGRPPVSGRPYDRRLHQPESELRVVRGPGNPSL